jgi:hypothetical protein
VLGRGGGCQLPESVLLLLRSRYNKDNNFGGAEAASQYVSVSNEHKVFVLFNGNKFFRPDLHKLKFLKQKNICQTLVLFVFNKNFVFYHPT